jgi:hypothetical protein
MSNHEHSRQHHSSDRQDGAATSPKKHRAWFLLAVVLMLIGMAAYVITLDDSMEPEGGANSVLPSSMPAAP